MELFSTHKNRLVIENDATMLSNRIAMLQQEEAKIMKKINQTRQRADEISKIKQRNDEMFETKMREREAKLQKEEDDRSRYYQDKADRQMNKARTLKAIKKAKREEFKVGKNMTLQHDVYKREFSEGVKQVRFGVLL
jgi:hypothetical protein